MSRKTYVRRQPLVAYLLLLSATIGAYFAYQTYLVPMVELTSAVKRSNSVDLQSYSPIEEDQSHHRWFKQAAWERESCSILHSAHGKILFQDFEREDDKTWLVFPFTMVMDREHDAKDPTAPAPLVLRCAKGARLKFDQPVSATGGTSNFRLVDAQLEGNVEVYRKSPNGVQDEMRIETSNVFIDDDQIVTIEDVAFWFGNNQGIGRNLKIQLSHHATGNQLSRDFSRIDGVTSVRLGYLSSMQLQPTKKDKAASDSSRAELMLSNDKTPVEITSAGPFQFDFATNLAQFEDQVRVRKLDAFGDSLRCERLILQFKTDGTAKSVSFDADNSNEFELVSMVAQGGPAVLEAHSQNAEVIGSSLQYDLTNQTVKVSDANRVQVKKDGSHFVAAAIEYELTQDNKLGALVAKGPGQLIRTDGENQFRASWDKLLKLNRVSDQQQLVNLTGDVKVKLDKDSELAGDEVNFLLWEVPVFDQQRKFVSWSYQPAKLEAIKHVRVTTEKLIADAKSLIVNWPNNPREVPPSEPAKTKLGRLEQGRGSVRAVAYTSRPAPIRHHQVRKIPQAAAQGQPEQPLVARSELIEVSVVDEQGSTTLTDLRMSGNVRVTRKMLNDPTRDEFEILGNSLRMIPQQENLFHVQLQGNGDEAARIKTDDMVLFGNDLFLDQLKNRMWVKGKGQVRLREQAKGAADPNRIAARRVSGVNKSQIKKLNVNFLGGMIFDGQRLYFERGVNADILQQEGPIQSSTIATGAALSITLDQELNFDAKRQSAESSNDPKIVQFNMRQSIPVEKTRFKQVGFANGPPEPVEIRHAKLGTNGEVLEQLTLRSPHALMNESKKELTASGPGSIRIHRKGSGGKAADGFGFLGKKTQSNSNQYTYIHVNFDNQLITNTETNAIAINGNLRSLYALVPSSKQEFDPDRSQKLPAGAVRLNCDQINVSKIGNARSPKAASRFVAFGKAHINSENFDSVADQISYRDDTDELVVESTSDKNVVLNFRRDSTSVWQQLTGAEVIYRPGDKTAEINKAGRISAEIGNGR